WQKQGYEMNKKSKVLFKGKVVNKAHTINTGVDEFPRYVVEYLIDNYCSEETFFQDMEKVVKRLKEAFVYGAESEKIRHYIRENRHHSIIANLEVRLVETEDKYWATIAAINESFVNIPEGIVRQYPMLLSGGMWGTIDLTYDETEIHNKKIRPFKITAFQEEKPHLRNFSSTSIQERSARSARATLLFLMRLPIQTSVIPKLLSVLCKASCKMPSSAVARKSCSHLVAWSSSVTLMCKA